MVNGEFLPIKSDVIFRTDEPLISDSQKYHHRFTFYDPVAGVEFSDIVEINTLELGKLPEWTDGTELYDWAKFIAAESEADMEVVADRNPEVKKAMIKYRELTTDERARDLYERREKARRDSAAREEWAAKKAHMEIAKRLLKLNMPIDEVVQVTDLTYEEIESLSDADDQVFSG